MVTNNLSPNAGQRCKCNRCMRKLLSEGTLILSYCLDFSSRHISKTSHVYRIFHFALFLGKIAVSYLKKNSITFQKLVLHFKKLVSHFEMIGDTYFTHFYPEQGAEIENHENITGIRNVSIYRMDPA